MNCLNCGTQVEDNFCPNCGQKTSTRRYSIKHIFDDGILNGVFSVNKRFFHTLLTLFKRPGHGIREYINGQRVKYINAFSFLLISIAFVYVLDEYSDIKLSDIIDESSKEFATSLERFMKKYPRVIYIINIPLMSISSFLFFRKSKVNIAENIILNTYVSSAQVLLTFPFTLITVFYEDKEVLGIIFQFISLISFLYTLWFYYQYFSAFEYRKRALVVRSIFSIIVFTIIQIIILAAIATTMKIE